MFSRCSQDFSRIFSGCSGESCGPQLFDDQIGSMDFDNPKVYGDTSITNGLVFKDKIDFSGQRVNFCLQHVIHFLKAIVLTVNLSQ